MSEIAIRVDHLSKLYRIGRAQQRHDTLRDAISDFGWRIADLTHPNCKSALENRSSEDLWALRDVTGPIFFRSTNQRPIDAETRRG